MPFQLDSAKVGDKIKAGPLFGFCPDEAVLVVAAVLPEKGKVEFNVEFLGVTVAQATAVKGADKWTWA